MTAGSATRSIPPGCNPTGMRSDQDAIDIVRPTRPDPAIRRVARTVIEPGVKTVETHALSVLRKLQLSNRYPLTRWAGDRRIV